MTSKTNLTINPQRLWDSLMDTAQFGGTPKGGIKRLTVSDDDRQVRDWFKAACEAAVTRAEWPARMQRLGPGALSSHVPAEAELWLDGGHNPSAGRVLAQAFSELNERHSRPLVMVWGMLNTKDVGSFIGCFAGIASRVITITIPDEENAVPAEKLAEAARAHGLQAETAPGIDAALRQASSTVPAPRILICGSLYLAGQVLKASGMIPD